MKVSVFQDIKKTTGGKVSSIDKVLDFIQDCKWDSFVERVQAAEDEVAKSEAKKTVPYFTVSGTFSKRTDAGLKKHSGLICMDYDHLTDIDELKSGLSDSPYVYAAFTSISGEGLAVICRVEADPLKHKAAFEGLKEHLKMFGLKEADESCKNISRARFISSDPEIYRNPEAEVFEVKIDQDQYLIDKIKRIVKNMIDSAQRGQVHNTLIRASRLMGGYIGGEVIEEHEGEEFLVDLMASKPHVESLDIEREKIRDGIANGKLEPITAETADKSLKSFQVWGDKTKKLYGFVHQSNRAGRTKAEMLNDAGEAAEQFELDLPEVKKVIKYVYENFKDEWKLDKKPRIVRVEHFLRKTWDFKKNQVTGFIESRPAGTSEKLQVINEAEIWRQVETAGHNFPQNKIEGILKSSFVKEYDPFLSYFKGLQWDGEDHISALASHITCKDQAFFEEQFRKHLVRCVICSTEHKENRFIFVLVGAKQSTGKSTFIRFLSPFGRSYYSESPLRDNKDSEIAFSENFIINLEELSHMNKIGAEKLKSMVSRFAVKERRAYGKKVEELPRRCNFFGSTNNKEFLSDVSNSRFLCFDVEDINWDYSNDIDIDQVWAQAFAMVQDGDNGQLTKSEAAKRDEINHEFEIESPERIFIKENYKPCEANAEGSIFVTSKDILVAFRMSSEFNPDRSSFHIIGRAMKQLGFADARSRINDRLTRGFWVINSKGSNDTSEEQKPFDDED